MSIEKKYLDALASAVIEESKGGPAKMKPSTPKDKKEISSTRGRMKVADTAKRTSRQKPSRQLAIAMKTGKGKKAALVNYNLNIKRKEKSGKESTNEESIKPTGLFLVLEGEKKNLP